MPGSIPVAVNNPPISQSDSLWDLSSPIAKRFHAEVSNKVVLTNEAVTALHSLLQHSVTLGIELDSIPVPIHTSQTSTENTEIRLIDASLKLLFSAAYGSEMPFHYSELKDDADTTFIIRQFNLLLTHHNYQQTLDSVEPGGSEYKALKRKLSELLSKPVSDSTKQQLFQVKESISSWRWLQRIKERRVILVNIPSADLRLLGTDTLHGRMKVIIGKPSTPTSVLTSYINRTVVYPYWTVPANIAEKEMLPKIKRNIKYLDDNSLQVIDKNGKIIDPLKIKWSKYSRNYFPYTIRQSTGCDNSLGLLKFEFNSPYGIYLHDTNEKDLFNRENRFLSHGCIRVERPLDLAEFILGKGAELNLVDSLYHCEMDQKPVFIPVAPKVPLLVLYMTADVDEGDSVIFYTDIYTREKNPLSK